MGNIALVRHIGMRKASIIFKQEFIKAEFIEIKTNIPAGAVVEPSRHEALDLRSREIPKK